MTDGTGGIGADSRWATYEPEPTAEERFQELARLLAVGVLRLRKRRLLAGEHLPPPTETVSKSVARRLEVPGKTVLSGPTG